MRQATAMRIALDARTIQDHFPGIARYTFNLMLALAAVAPHDELLLLYHPAQRNTRFDLLQLAAKTNVQLIDTDAPTFSPREQWRIPSLLSQMRADLYHSPYYIMPYLTRLPTIVTVHDLIPLVYPHYFTSTQRLIFNITMRLAIRSTCQVIAVSQATADDLRKLLRVPAAKITIIPEAADPAMTRASPDAIASIRARYQLPDAYVLYMGSNKPHKNLTRLVEAFARVRNRAQNPLVIAGHWDERQPEVKQSDAVRWLGPVPQAELPALYSGASMFVFPSEYEGFGLPVLEAMACGTPVICSNSSSLPEVAGDAALLVDPHDVDSWSQAMHRMLDDDALRAQLAERGLRRAQDFSWTQVARQTYTLMRSLVK